MTFQIATRKGKIEVPSIATCSPHFVITPYVESLVGPTLGPTLSKTFYVIIHVHSGQSVLQRVRGKRKAQLLAAVFAAMPVSWDKITDAPSAMRYFAKEMPAWAFDWRKQHLS